MFSESHIGSFVENRQRVKTEHTSKVGLRQGMQEMMESWSQVTGCGGGVETLMSFEFTLQDNQQDVLLNEVWTGGEGNKSRKPRFFNLSGWKSRVPLCRDGKDL